MEMWLTVVVVALPVLLSVWASVKVVRDEFSERRQKVVQLVLVWLVPIIGALIVIGVHKKSEKPSGQYREGVDPGEDFALSGVAARRTLEALDGD